MEGVRKVQYKGKEILIIDYSNCGKDPQKVLAIASEAVAVLSKMPPHSALTLTNVKSFAFNTEIINKFKETLVTTKDRRKKLAIIGIDDGFRSFLYHAITKFAGTDMPVFDSEAEAMEWLVKEE